MNWTDPENLRLGDTDELIEELDAKLGNPTGKKRERTGPVDLAEHMARKKAEEEAQRQMWQGFAPGSIIPVAPGGRVHYLASSTSATYSQVRVVSSTPNFVQTFRNPYDS